MSENNDENVVKISDARNRQRLAALEASKRVRARRKELRLAVKAGDIDPLKLIAGELDEWEDDIAAWRVEQLLRIVPSVGSVTLQEILTAFQISPRAKVRAMTYKRRGDLAKLVADATQRPYVR